MRLWAERSPASRSRRRVERENHPHYLVLNHVDIPDILCPKSDHFSGTTRDNAGTIGIGGAGESGKTKWNARLARISPAPENPNLNPSLSVKLL